MAANNVSTLVQKMKTVLAYALLEWILILLLLLNSLLTNFIAKFTKHFGLKPSCPFCTNNFNLDYVCEAHKPDNRCWNQLDFAHKKAQIIDTDPGISDVEDESVYKTDMLLQNADGYTDSDFICIELIGTDTARLEDKQLHELADSIREEDLKDKQLQEQEEFVSIDRLQSIINVISEELEDRRKTSKEAMEMIKKLQEDKHRLQIEALQLEEQAEYDQEALQLLNQLVIKRNKEKQQLEKELEMHRNEAVFEYGENVWDVEENNSWGDDLGKERMSILEELKALEAKLIALHNNEMLSFGGDEEMETMDHSEKKLG